MDCFIRFYEELNFFLHPQFKKQEFTAALYRDQSIKDLIESLGVPHTEVDLILVNGESVDFSYRPEEGDRISVYPVFESFNIKSITKLRPEPLRDLIFILDVHLGKLTNKLRMLGFDCLYHNDFKDDQIAKISNLENRIVLTRDRGLLKRSIITRGYILRSDDPDIQLKEVIIRFDLKPLFDPLTRCMSCNGTLISVDKKKVLSELEPKTIKYFKDFKRCDSCGKLYWKGSHYESMIYCVNKMLKT